jgi:hypothetical protein
LLDLLAPLLSLLSLPLGLLVLLFGLLHRLQSLQLLLLRLIIVGVSSRPASITASMAMVAAPARIRWTGRTCRRRARAGWISPALAVLILQIARFS